MEAVRGDVGTVRVLARPAVAPVRADREPADVGTELERLARRRRALDVQQAQLVARARAENVGWAEIGRRLGVTGQAVQMRYGRAR